MRMMIAFIRSCSILRHTIFAMIKYNPKNWMGLIFHQYSRQIYKKLLPSLLLILVIASATTYVEIEVLKLEDGNYTAIHSLLGFALAMFLVFRTNTAYDRWWEGRKLWGAMVNNTRNLAMKVKSFIKDEEVSEWMYVMIKNYPLALRGHLRFNTEVDAQIETTGWKKDQIAKYDHIPNQIALRMYQKLNDLNEKGELSNEHLILFDRDLKTFTDILGGCERILNTPIPYSYSMYLKKFIFIYVITLPLGVVGLFGYWTIPVVIMVFYVLVSIELIAEEIEDPFGMDDNDLPTTELSIKIGKNIDEIKG